MTALSTFPAITKMVLMLSSNQPGEVVAAAAAIDRSLKGAGRDWFDLVRAIENGAASLVPVRKVEPAADAITETDMARFCLGRQAELTSSERDFVRTVLKKLAYGDSLSTAQAKWLKAIYLGLGGAVQ